MWNHDCGAIPVLDGGGLVVGMITDRDICMAAAYIQGRALADIPVMTAASHRVYSVKPNDRIEMAEVLMERHRIRRVPVIDIGGNLVGIIGFADLTRHVQEMSDPTSELSPERLTSAFASLNRSHELRA